MSSAVVRLPDRQLAELRAAYERAAAAKRARTFAALAVVAVLLGLSAVQAEVDPKTFIAKIGGFFSYFDRLATLDSGRRVWTDPVEWFWAFKRDARLIGETILMAYVGTLTGGILGFGLNFLASPNLTTDGAVVFLARRFLEFCRTVPGIVFALMFVVAFGLGPLPACWRSPSTPRARLESSSSRPPRTST